MSLKKAVDTWRSYAQIYFPKTLKSYSNFKFLLSYFKGKTIRTTTKQDVMAFINIRKKEGSRKRAPGTLTEMIQTDVPVENSTINRNIFQLAALFRAVKVMLPEKFGDVESPTRGIPSLPIKKKYGVKLKFYNEAQLKLLGAGGPESIFFDNRFKRTHSPIGILIQILVKTGCRASEAIHLKWKNINLDERRLTFIDTKNKSDRDVPISEDLYKFLYEVRSEQNFKYDHPVTNRNGTSYLSYPRDSLKRYVTACHIKYKGIHSIRHGVVTALRKRFGERLTKPIVGHSTSSIHELYTHCEWNELLEAIQILDF